MVAIFDYIVIKNTKKCDFLLNMHVGYNKFILLDILFHPLSNFNTLGHQFESGKTQKTAGRRLSLVLVTQSYDCQKRCNNALTAAFDVSTATINVALKPFRLRLSSKVAACSGILGTCL
jgi:hypothetical protein